jgi:hypothetical protein
VENIKDPLYRYFEREVNSGAKLLQDVIHDLEDVVLICQVSKHTEHFRMMEQISKNYFKQTIQDRNTFHMSLDRGRFKV